MPVSPEALARRVYPANLDPKLLPPASYNTLNVLLYLESKGLAAQEPAGSGLWCAVSLPDSDADSAKL